MCIKSSYCISSLHLNKTKSHKALNSQLVCVLAKCRHYIYRKVIFLIAKQNEMIKDTSTSVTVYCAGINFKHITV